jgi:hypothetical protein
LNGGYKDVPFEKYFETTREWYEIKVPIGMDWVLGHLETWSMYQIYIKKYKDNAGYEDPKEVYKKSLLECLEKAKEKNVTLDQERPFVVTIPYSVILAKNI